MSKSFSTWSIIRFTTAVVRLFSYAYSTLANCPVAEIFRNYYQPSCFTLVPACFTLDATGTVTLTNINLPFAQGRFYRIMLTNPPTLAQGLAVVATGGAASSIVWITDTISTDGFIIHRAPSTLPDTTCFIAIPF